MITDAIFRLRVTLRGTEPPVWRLVDVPADIPMYYLHHVLQRAMGWSDSHAYGFSLIRRYTADATTSRDLALPGSRFIELNDLAVPGDSMLYEYDFSDRWQHEIVVEAERAREWNASYPRVVAGDRACPPDGVGGPSGYAAFVKELHDPDCPSHESVRVRLGGRFDPETFDRNRANRWIPRHLAYAEEGVEPEFPMPGLRPPVSHLMLMGEPEYDVSHWPDYRELGIGIAHLPDLIMMLNDRAFNWDEDSNAPWMWAPVHAWRAIGQLGNMDAVPAVFEMMLSREDDEWMYDEIPSVLAMMGPAVFPVLTEFFWNRANGTRPRAMSAKALTLLAEEHPELRATTTATITNELFRKEGNDPEFNAMLVGDLGALRVVQALPDIERMMKSGQVDESLIGGWEDVQIAFGVLEERTMPHLTPPLLDELEKFLGILRDKDGDTPTDQGDRAPWEMDDDAHWEKSSDDD